MKRTEDVGTSHVDGAARLSRHQGLYIAGGAAALIAALLFRRNPGEEFVVLQELGVIHAGPTGAPSSAGEWFALLDSNRLIDLTLFNVFDPVNYGLVALALAPVPVLLAIPPSAAAPFRLVWYLLIGRRLFQLAAAEKGDGETALN